MKINIVENKSDPTQVMYPRLMIDRKDIDKACKNPLIVLFFNQEQGIVITGNPKHMKEYREAEMNGDVYWGNDQSDVDFVPFLGEITLIGE